MEEEETQRHKMYADKEAALSHLEVKYRADLDKIEKIDAGDRALDPSFGQ